MGTNKTGTVKNKKNLIQLIVQPEGHRLALRFFDEFGVHNELGHCFVVFGCAFVLPVVFNEYIDDQQATTASSPFL